MGPPLFGLHPIRDFSHLDYRCLDYKAIWTTPNWTTYDVWTFAVWTTKTFGLFQMDYHNLNYNPNRLHHHLEYIRSDYLQRRWIVI